MTWVRWKQAAPAIAAFARAELERRRVMRIGALRQDGAPRIRRIERFIREGELYLGMMGRSRKALALRRDPRLAQRNPVGGRDLPSRTGPRHPRAGVAQQVPRCRRREDQLAGAAFSSVHH
jgi:hypothetical protein